MALASTRERPDGHPRRAAAELRVGGDAAEMMLAEAADELIAEAMT